MFPHPSLAVKEANLVSKNVSTFGEAVEKKIWQGYLILSSLSIRVSTPTFFEWSSSARFQICLFSRRHHEFLVQIPFASIGLVVWISIKPASLAPCASRSGGGYDTNWSSAQHQKQFWLPVLQFRHRRDQHISLSHLRRLEMGPVITHDHHLLGYDLLHDLLYSQPQPACHKLKRLPSWLTY